MMVERFRRWLEYERDSHAKVLASLDAVPEDLRSSALFQKAVDLLAHIVAARSLWLHRLGAASSGPGDLFPRQVPLSELPEQLDAMERAWTAYLDRIDDAAIDRVFAYRSLEGQSYRNRVEDILAQLYGHSWYHRGQIALLLRQLGAEPAATDLVFWTREPLPQETST